MSIGRRFFLLTVLIAAGLGGIAAGRVSNTTWLLISLVQGFVYAQVVLTAYRAGLKEGDSRRE